MWRKQEEPKVSPTPQQNVATPSAPANNFPQPSPANVQPAVPVSAPPPQISTRETTVPKRATSIVCKGIFIRGQVTGNEDLQIDGEVSGSVQLAGARVAIGPEGRVEGSINAREIIVRGDLKGNLRATERITVGHTGRWHGDGVAPKLAIEEGAVVKGKLEVAEEPVKPIVAKPAAAIEAEVKQQVTSGTGSAGPNGVAAAKFNGNGANGNGAVGEVTMQNEPVAVKAGPVASNA